MGDNDEKLAQFQSITGCDSDRAQFYLESAGWALDLAMASFYEGDGGEGEGEEGGAGGAAPAAAPPGNAPAPPAAPQGRINIGTMDVSDSDSDEDQQAFYAGGSSTSGNVILGPKKKKFDVGSMFKAAREAGAEEVAPGEGHQGPSATRAFQGGGFRLGSEDVASTQVGTPSQPKPEERHFVLKMWRDGFSVDGGELRKYQDPASEEFMKSVMRGAIPAELVKEAKGGEVHVDMEDHREEEFVREKVAAKPFQGSGNVLGSIAPAVAAPPPASNADPKQAEEAAAAEAKVDSGSPVSSIQVRLADGSRLVVKLNHSHRVSDLRRYITTARPQYAGTPFALLTTFPNKELTEEGQTIAEAGLLGAAVLQRLK